MLFFSWSPAGMSLPGALFNTEYEFSLYEVRPPNTNANIVVATTLPIYTVTTNQTFINYGITEASLQIGMEYVWRVRAVDVTGRDVYKNSGYSQVCSFTYGSLGELIAGGITLDLNASALGPRLGIANWNASSAFTEYTLEVRKKGGSYSWFPFLSNEGTVKVTGLEPSTEYECRVKGTNGSYTSEYSNMVNFTTPPVPVYGCNSTSLPPVEGGAKPLQFLHIGNVINAGQFEVTVTNVLYSSGSGLFSGFGKVHVPFTLLNFGVHFENVWIDENLAMKSGKMVFLTNGIDAWASDLLGGGTDADFNFEGDADSVLLDGNQLIIFSDGDTVVIDYPGGSFTIEDENGDSWTVYPNGDVVFTPGVPQIYMTYNEKLMYKYAARDIKYEYANAAKLDPLLNSYNGSLNEVRNKGTTSIGVNYFDVAPVGSPQGKLVEVELTQVETDVNTFYDARTDWKAAEVLTRFTANGLNNEELNLLAGYMYIDGVKSIDFVRTRIAAGDATQDIVARLKTEMVNYIRKLVREGN